MIFETIIISCFILPFIKGFASKLGKISAEKLNKKLKELKWINGNGKIVSREELIINLKKILAENLDFSVEDSTLYEIIDNLFVNQIFEELIKSAKKEVKLISPFISWKEISNIISNLPPNVKISIIANKTIKDENIRKIKNIKLNMIDNLHEQLLIIDNMTCFLWSGTFSSSIYKDEVKTIFTYDNHLEILQSYIKQFNSIYEMSERLF